MNRCRSLSMKQYLSRAVIPLAPGGVYQVGHAMVPSTVTFAVNPRQVVSPQTGHLWYVELEHDMQNARMYSLIPQPSNNQYVSHYEVETARPRFAGKFAFADAWMTTNHLVMTVDKVEVHLSMRFYNPDRTSDSLFFQGDPVRQIEVTAPFLIGDREIFRVLERVLPEGSEIEQLVPRLS